MVGRLLRLLKGSRTFPTVLVSLLFLLAIACSPDSEPTGDGPTTVSIMMPMNEYGLSWHAGSQAQLLVFSPLVARNAEGDLEPRLAASWEHSPDYREWTVTLNTEARWHDGVPVTADDVKFTLDLLARGLADAGIAAYQVGVVNDSTYTIRYDRPGIGNPLDDFTVIYPKHVLEGLDQENWADWDFWKEPVGSGPFRHVRTIEGLGFEFEANPDYFRGRPRIDRVLLKFGAPQLTQLQSGEVDILPNVSELMAESVEDDPRFAVYRWPNTLRSKAIQWNHRSPLFQDARVRKALAMATDRRNLIRAARLPESLPIFDGLYSEDQLRRGETPAAVPYDPDTAARLLEEAGWRDTDGDGIRDRDGVPFWFTLLFGGSGGGWTAQGGEAVALLFQEAVRPLGIQVELQPLQGSVKRERMMAGDFDAVVEDVVSLVTRVWAFGEDNYLGYDNPTVVDLLDRIGEAFNPDSVDAYYRELAAIFAEDHPVLFLYPAVGTFIVNRRVKGVIPPHRADPVWYLEDLWVDEGSIESMAPNPNEDTR